MSNEKNDEVENDENNDQDILYTDLTQLDPDMDSFWWHRITGKNFAFKEKIVSQKRCKIHIGDVLIHKKKVEGKMFPDINYFLVLDNGLSKEPIKVINKMIKSHLGEKIIEFVQKYHKLPYACKFIKAFKNGNVQIDYKPTKWDKFAIDISVKKGQRYNIEELQDFLTDELPEISENPLEVIKQKIVIRR